MSKKYPHRYEFRITIDLAEGQDEDGWSDSILLAVESLIEKKEARIVGGVGIQGICEDGKHDEDAEKQATFTYCGDCTQVDEASGP